MALNRARTCTKARQSPLIQSSLVQNYTLYNSISETTHYCLTIVQVHQICNSQPQGRQKNADGIIVSIVLWKNNRFLLAGSISNCGAAVAQRVEQVN